MANYVETPVSEVALAPVTPVTPPSSTSSYELTRRATDQRIIVNCKLTIVLEIVTIDLSSSSFILIHPLIELPPLHRI